MTFDGFDIRIRRLMDQRTKRFIFVPMDHGVTVGPVKGIEDPSEIINRVTDGGATSVVVHKGLVESGMVCSSGKIGLTVHLSASTALSTNPNAKVLVCSVEEAIKLGADGISVHVNIGADTEMEMLEDLGNVSRSCREWRIPLLAMVYTRGPEIENELDPDNIKHAARLAAELGADIVKTNYTGDIDTFREVVRGCPSPIVIAGGPRMDTDEEVLQMIFDSIEAGGKGVSIGRNIFQHKDPTSMVKAVRKIVISNSSVEEAMKLL